jgi:hypothetical protein
MVGLSSPRGQKTARQQIPLNVKRGYDSPQLFYDDALLRIRPLESEVKKKN